MQGFTRGSAAAHVIVVGMRSLVGIVALAVAHLTWLGALAADPGDTEFADVVLVGAADRAWCSGVAITPTRILTAQHCLGPGVTHIGIGSTEGTARRVKVVASVAHPIEDVAIHTIDAALTVTPRPWRRATSPPNGPIAIVGFGVTDQVELSDFGTRHVRRVHVDGWGCDRRRAQELSCRPASEFLLRGGRGVDTCFGDSGGGAFERVGKSWRLLGVTSRGTTARRALCGEGGVYVRVDVIASWIEEQTK
jgi:hypothetical protein